MELSWHTQELEFLKPAKTSRGEYLRKKHHVLRLVDGVRVGVGEAAPLPDLSPEGDADPTQELNRVSESLRSGTDPREVLESLEGWPSLRFALHCALECLDLPEESLLVQNDFTAGKSGIPINGLVWMNDLDAMYEEANAKLRSGYSCIKFKVGSLDPDAECRMLEKIRQEYPDVEIRLDANGAFTFADALQILNEYSRFRIQSLEQPIKAGQWEAMQEICAKSPVAIALDEELIAVSFAHAVSLLETVKPAFLVLKPTLLGGLDHCDAWIALAGKREIGWWSTSALEGNIGLAAIAQWVSTKQVSLAQGLGTGSLYKNNFPAQTRVEQGVLYFMQRPRHQK